MIDECMAGNIDMVITKSISRFARNTLDCLQYLSLIHISLADSGTEEDADTSTDAAEEAPSGNTEVSVDVSLPVTWRRTGRRSVM